MEDPSVSQDTDLYSISQSLGAGRRQQAVDLILSNMIRPLGFRKDRRAKGLGVKQGCFKKNGP